MGSNDGFAGVNGEKKSNFDVKVNGDGGDSNS